MVNASNKNAIYADAYTLTVNGGTVEAKSTYSYGGRGLFCGALVFNGGNLKLEGYWGVMCNINTAQTVTLNWRNASDRVYISDFDPDFNTVNIGGAGGKCFTDGEGNYYGGTYTRGFSAFSGKTLQPATARTLSLPDGVTATGALFTDSGVDYYAPGSTVTLSDLPAAAAGYLDWQYTVNGTPIDGTSFTMPASKATIALTHQPDPAHFSLNAAGTEYTIWSAEGWDVFCDCISDKTYNRFSGKTVKLGADISVSREANVFYGNFDGQGHTLNFTITTEDNNVDGIAPFYYIETKPSDINVVSPPAIRNLNVVVDITTGRRHASGLVGRSKSITIEGCTVSGTIRTSNFGAGGFIGELNKTANIINCVSSITIIDSRSGGVASNGGFVGEVSEGDNLYFEGCLFNGKLLTTANGRTCGGFVGDNNKGTVTVTNCVYAPAALAEGETWEGTLRSATFVRNYGGHGEDGVAIITNSYYTQEFNDGTNQTGQGKQLRSIMAGENVSVEHAGVAKAYGVSGITAYKESDESDSFTAGIEYGGVLYAGSGDAVSLTLGNSAGAPLGYQYGYSASGDATLDGSTLTMADADVTVSLALAPIDWATENEGTEADPYMIYNKDQLDMLAERVNNGCSDGGDDDYAEIGYKGKHFKLGADIAYDHTTDWNDTNSEENNFVAIGRAEDNSDRSDYEFRGHFDGKEYQGAIAGFNSLYSILEHNYYTACTIVSGQTATPTASGIGVGLGHNSDKGSYDLTEDEGNEDCAVPALRDNADNSTALALLAGLPADLDLGWGAGKYPVQLAGRKLWKDGAWNTLVLPFDVTIADSPLAGAEARPLSAASITGTTLNLTFGDAVSTLVAGTPYIIKWASGDDIVNPVFSGVTIDAKDRSFTSGSGDTQVRFIGTYDQKAIDTEDQSILFLSAENTLYYPSGLNGGVTINPFRAYFKIGEDEAHNARQLTAFNFNFGDGDATRISASLVKSEEVKSEKFYSLDGRRLNGKPTARGIYINNGRKVVVK